MKRSRSPLVAVAGLSLAVAVAAVASAASNPVADRQAMMKQVGQAMKESSAYATGRTAWDAKEVKEEMAKVSGAAKSLKGLYPAGSDKDAKSEALPAIWQNKADFDKKLAAMGAAAETAGKAADAASFKPAFQAVGATCAACHNTYRKKATS